MSVKTPANINFLSGHNFLFEMEKLKDAHFFVTAVNLPEISAQVATAKTLFSDIPLTGTKLEWSPLVVTFQVDEEMNNWFEIYQWLYSYTIPKTFTDYGDLKKGKQRNLEGEKTRPNGLPILKDKRRGDVYSNATLIINTSHNNGKTIVHYEDCFPISLTQLDFSTQKSQEEYLTATVTFRYIYYSVERI